MPAIGLYFTTEIEDLDFVRRASAAPSACFFVAFRGHGPLLKFNLKPRIQV